MTTIPSQLGPYTIDREIGRGGMGVVYLGRDTKLDRAVAIKALPEFLAADPDRLIRFEREAKTLAQLNHPNVAGIHGVEEFEGARYLILEYVDGSTLSERLDSGPLAVDEAILVCAQIAAGLEAAHDAGVIHRDLKPANIKITPAGHVKVLDFGLAKTTESASTTGSSMSQAPTMSMPATPNSPTTPGAILGTAPYMSPEQARGRTLDQRSDIWSFGVVLYECLTGLSPFAGETISDSIGAILHRDPDISLLPADTPASVRHLLRRCLQRDKTKRLHSIADARIELEDPGEVGEAAAQTKRASPLAIASIAAACLVVGVVATWFIAPMLEEAPPRPVPMRLLVESGSEELLRLRGGTQFAISPDGTKIVFLAGENEESSSLYLRSLDQLGVTRLAGTTDAAHPFFSPDGQSVGFFAQNKLKKVSIAGGTPLALCDVGGAPRGGTWGDDGTIIFTPNTGTGMYKIRETGGEPEVLTEPDSEARERSHRWPHMLPGSKAVLFTSQLSGDSFDEASIEVLDLETLERTVLHPGGSNPRYAASGHIVFGREGTVYAAPFDAERLELLAPPGPVIDGVVTGPDTGEVQLALSFKGTLIYNSGDVARFGKSLVWVDRDGTRTPLDPTDRDVDTLSISPDGSRLALEIAPDAQSADDIWIYEIERQVMSRLTFGEGDEITPFWSPDGQQIVYATAASGSQRNLFVKRADGSDQPTRLTTSDNMQIATDWSPDGNFILYCEDTGDDFGWDILTLDLSKDPPEPEVFLQTPFHEVYGSFSPNGKWIAYQSNESGQFEVYVRGFPDAAGRWQVSTSGGGKVIWSPDGTEIYYLEDGAMMVVPITSEGEAFSVGRAEELFRQGPPSSFWYPTYDVMPEGDRFVMLYDESDEEQQNQHQLTFVFNWFEELRERVGQGGGR